MRILPAEVVTTHGDGIVIYNHEHNGHLVRTHRTVRTSPAGWVWAVHDEHGNQIAQSDANPT